MKKFFYAVIIFFLLAPKASAIEEIVPDFKEEITIEETTLLERIFEQKKIQLNDKNQSYIEYGLNYKGINDFTIYNNGFGSRFNFHLEPYVHAKFGEQKDELRIAIVPTSDFSGYDNKFTRIFSDLYFIKKINKNHQVLIGNSRTPIGWEGGMSSYSTPFIQRSQIAGKFGDVRALGIRFRGNVKKLDYDLGGYFSTRYMQHLNEGGEFVGWLDYRPFSENNKYLKNLKIGAGLNYGRQGENYTVLSSGVKWDYEKIFLTAEYGFAQNYNGRGNFTNAKAQGANATIGYNLTDKVQILARYDYFDPDMNRADNNIVQYSAGINWFVLKQRLRFSANYIFEQEKDNNKNKVLLLTQFLI